MNDVNDMYSVIDSGFSARTPRQKWMAVIARATLDEIRQHLGNAPALPAFICLRPPETGLVMVKARVGGSGAAFNLGETTVTRCSIRDERGRIGHAYLAGRDRDTAELAARLDAVLQDPERFQAFHEAVVVPLAESQLSIQNAEARRAAATEVEFFNLKTMRS